jgi:hypothetical protein
VTSRSSEHRFLSLGHYTVRVEWSIDIDVELADAGVVGDSDVQAGVIRVRSDLPLDRRREVVLHELLHHVVHLTHLGAKWDDDEQEEVIRAISPWLAQAVSISNYDRG